MIQDPESGTNTGVIFGCGRMLIAVLNVRNEARKLLSPQMLPSFSKRRNEPNAKKKATNQSRYNPDASVVLSVRLVLPIILR